MPTWGAGQGEADGPLKTAAVIGRVAAVLREVLRKGGITDIVDVWYLDDGQIFGKLSDVGRVLRALDEAFTSTGACRGRQSLGTEVKSTLRVFVPEAEAARAAFRADAYIMDSTIVHEAAGDMKVLGT
jgi:hypothetical protein